MSKLAASLANPQFFIPPSPLAPMLAHKPVPVPMGRARGVNTKAQQWEMWNRYLRLARQQNATSAGI